MTARYSEHYGRGPLTTEVYLPGDTPPLKVGPIVTDADYQRAIDRVYHERGRGCLAALVPYSREPDLRKAMDDYNATAAVISDRFSQGLADVQDARAKSQAAAAAARDALVTVAAEPVTQGRETEDEDAW